MIYRVANPKMLAHETMYLELGALSNPSPASQKFIGLSFSAKRGPITITKWSLISIPVKKICNHKQAHS